MQFQKALLYSFCLHLLLIPCFSFLCGVQAKPLPQKKMIELEMVSLGDIHKPPGLEGASGAEGAEGKAGSQPIVKQQQPAKPEPPQAPEIHKPSKPVAPVKNIVKNTAKSAVKTKPTTNSRKDRIESRPAASGHISPSVPTPTGGSGGGAAPGDGTGSGSRGSGSGSGGSGTGSGSGGSGTGSGSGGSGTGSGGGGGSREYQPPQLLSKVEPRYPREAREQGITGRVLLTIQVLTNGHCGTVIVKQSSGHGSLDQAAMDAVKKWRFVPAKDRQSGQSFACTTTLPVVFRLK